MLRASSALLLLFTAPVPVAAQVVRPVPAPTGAGGPKLDSAGNGTPVITINRPNAAGVSNNQYTSFDVGASNLILNNSATVTTTQAGGYVAANPNLAGGAANVILNQVAAGGSPSRLAGYIEVAGQRAQVVVANAAGIYCSGCGVINANRFTLTTGDPLFNGAGAIIGYNVRGGVLTIDGAGLDASTADTLDLIVGALQANASIWANRANVAYGGGQVAADVSGVTPLDGVTVAAPFAVNIGALAGFYGNSIRMIGAQSGLGVKIDGSLASLEQPFTLTSGGQIVVTGHVSSASDVNLSAAGDVSVSGTLYAGGSASVAAGGQFVTSGFVGAQGAVTAQAAAVASSGVLAAGIDQNGILGGAAPLSVSAGGTVALSGQTLASGAATITGGSINLSGGQLQASSIGLTSGGGLSLSGGQVFTPGALTVSAAGTLANGGLLQGSAVSLGLGGLDNRGGGIVQAGSGQATITVTGDADNSSGQILSADGLALSAGGRLANGGGLIQTGGALSVDAASLVNGGGGRILAVGAAPLALTVTGAVDGRNGVIAASGDLSIAAASLDASQGGLVQAGGLATVHTGGLTLDGGALNAGTLDLRAGTSSNRGGQIVASGRATLSATSLDNTGGVVQAGDALTLTADALTNSAGGKVLGLGAGAVALTIAGAADNGGGIIGGNGDVVVQAGGFTGRGGTVQAAGALSLTAASIDAGQGGSLLGGAVNLSTAGTLDLTRGGQVGAVGLAQIDAATVLNDGGQIRAGTLRLTAGELSNTAGGEIRLTGSGASSLTAGVLDNSGGAIAGAGDLALSLSRLTNTGGQITALHDLTLTSTGDLANSGQIDALHQVMLSIGGTFDNTGQGLQVSGGLTLTAGAVDNAGGTITAAGSDGLAIAATGAIDNRLGTIGSNGGLTLTGASLANAGAGSRITARSALTVTAVSGDVDSSQGGVIAAAGDATVQAHGAVDASQGGGIQGGGTLWVTAATVRADAGGLFTGGALQLSAGDLSNAGGELSATSGTGASQITVTGTLANSGLIGSRGGLAVSAGQLSNAVAGQIQAAGALQLSGGAVQNAGQIAALGTSALTASLGGSLVNTGQMAGGGDVAISAASIASRGSGSQILSTGGGLALTASAGDIDASQGGLLAAGGSASVQASGFTDVSSAGQLQAGAGLSVSGGGLRTDSGGVALADSLSIDVGTLSNHGGTLAALSLTTGSSLAAGGLFDNAGGQVALAGPSAQIRAATLANEGGVIAMTGSGALTATVSGDLTDTASGKIAANGALALTVGGQLDASGGLVQSGQGASLAAGSLTATGGAIVQTGTQGLTLSVAGAISARGGLIGGAGDVSLSGAAIDLGGTGGRLTAGGQLTAQALTGALSLSGGGQAVAGGAADLTAGTRIDASGGGLIQAATTARLAAPTIVLDNGGALQANALALTTANLSNRAGSILQTGAGDLTLSASGAIDNTGGTIAANAANLTLQAGAIANAGGQVQHTGTGLLTVAASGAVSGEGSLVTNGALAVSGATVDVGTSSAAGALSLTASNGALTIGGATTAGGALALSAASGLTNNATVQAGTTAAGGLSVTAGAVSNNGQLIAAHGQGVSIAAAGLTNASGAVIGSTGTVNLTASSIRNAGSITAGTLSVAGLGALDNTSGVIQASAPLTLAMTGALTNTGGQIQSSGALSISAASLGNAAGKVASGAGGLTIGLAGNLDNSAGGQIGGPGAVTITAGSLNDTGGQIAGGSSVGLTVSGAFTGGAGGLVYAGSDLNLNAGSVSNGASIAAAHNLGLSTGWLYNTGSITANGDASVYAGAVAGVGQIAAGGSLTFTTPGALNPEAGSKLSAGVNLTVNASSLVNSGTLAAGQGTYLNIAGGLTNYGSIDPQVLSLNVGGMFTNTGLINGDTVSISAGGLSNTGQIFGTDLTLNTGGGGISNDGGAAAIAGRSTLNLYSAGTISNTGGAQIYSQGSLTIAGQNGSGQAGAVNNVSSTIQSAGDMAISAVSINNSRPALTFVDQSSVGPVTDTVSDPSCTFTTSDPNCWEQWSQITVTGVSAYSNGARGYILAGGNLSLWGDVNNYVSTISAGGNLNLTGNLNNISYDTTLTYDVKAITDTGVVHCAFTGGQDDCWGGASLGQTTTPTGQGLPGVTLPNLVANWAGMVDSRDDLSTNWYVTHALHIQPCVYNGTVAQEACFGRYWYFQYAVPRGDSIYVTPLGSRTYSESSWVVGGNPDATAVFTAGGALNVVGSISNLTLNADGTPASGHIAAVVGGTQRGLLYATGQGAAAGSGASASTAVSGAAVQGATVASASGQGVTGAALTAVSGPGGVAGAAGVAAAGAGASVGGVTRAAGGPAGLPTLSISALAGLYKVPTGGLWVMNTSPGAHYLVGLNSAFGASNGVSSDQYLQALGYDPDKIEQRLGDGAYEQQLVQQQLLGLTGKSVLAGYSDQSSEYAALLDAGAAYAQQLGLAPGVGLTAEQMASLTSDMVLLVDTVVQTPNGPEHVLAPQLYLTAADAKDLSTTGSLIAANSLNLNAGSGSVVNTGTMLATSSAKIQAGDILNGGFIDGGQLTQLTAANGLTNKGAISGQTVGLTAGTLDLVKGGQVNAQDLSLYSTASLTLSQTSGLNVTNNLQATSAGNLTLDALKLDLKGSAAFAAGGNLTLAADTAATGLNLTGSNLTFASQAVTHDLTSITAGGAISFSAGGDLVSQGAQVKAGGLLTAVAGGNIALQSVTDSQSVAFSVKEGSHGNTVATYAEQVQGSSFSGAAGVGLVAGVTSPAGAISIQASNVSSTGGAVTLAAAGNVSITSGTEEHDSSVQTYSKKSGFLSSSSKSTNDVSDVTGVVASTVSGNTVQVAAGGDLSVIGSNVASTLGTSLSAGGNLTIAAATASDHEQHDVTTKQNGVFGTGGVGFTIGGQKTSTSDVSDQTTAVAALVGATNGNVSLAAGKDVTITGSQVVAGGLGGVAIQGQNVTIQAAEQTSTDTSTYKHSQSGLTVALHSPLISAAQTISSVASAAADSGDARVQALAAGTAGLAAYNAYSAVTNNPLNVSVTATFGSSSVKSTETQSSTTWLGSQVQGGAGGVTVLATGAGKDSTLKVVGSSISSSGDVTLGSSGAIDLQAAQDTTSQTGKSSSSGWSAGVVIDPTGFGVTGSASESSGKQNGSSVTNVNTEIAAGRTATLISGGDTTLKGADVAGNAVVANVGGDLLIQSLQDTSNFKSQNQSAGFNFTATTGGASGGLDLSHGKENSTYASVTEQSGIQAGAGGFDITVAGNTNLVGGLIASTAPAAANSLTTGTLTYSDIKNAASYDASQTSISLGRGTKPAQSNAQGQVVTQGGGFQLGSLGGFSATPPSALSAGGSESSTTKSAASAGTITITDAAGQAALTGQTPDQALAGLSRDTSADTTGALKTIFDPQKIQDAFTVTQAFQQQVGQLLTDKAAELDKAKKQASDPSLTQDQRDAAQQQVDSLQAWAPGGTYNQIVTALSAGAGGNVTGGMGQFAQAAAANWAQQQVAGAIGTQADLGRLDPASAAALHALAACAGSAAGGGSCASGAAGAAASSLVGVLIQASDSSGLSDSERQAATNLLGSLVAGVASAAGGDAASASASAMAEAANNTFGPASVAAQQFRDLKAACASGPNPDACGKQVADLEKAYLDNPKDYSSGVLTKVDPNSPIVCVASVPACNAPSTTVMSSANTPTSASSSSGISCFGQLCARTDYNPQLAAQQGAFQITLNQLDRQNAIYAAPALAPMVLLAGPEAFIPFADVSVATGTTIGAVSGGVGGGISGYKATGTAQGAIAGAVGGVVLGGATGYYAPVATSAVTSQYGAWAGGGTFVFVNAAGGALSSGGSDVLVNQFAGGSLKDLKDDVSNGFIIGGLSTLVEAPFVATKVIENPVGEGVLSVQSSVFGLFGTAITICKDNSCAPTPPAAASNSGAEK